MRPIPHDDCLRVPEPPENGLAFLGNTECKDGSSPEAILYSSDDQYIPEKRTSEPKRINQQEIEGLIRARSLSKRKTELLVSRLKERNIVLRAATVCHYRIRNNALKIFFRLGGLIVFCHDINGFIH
jgi:hypothetical protein